MVKYHTNFNLPALVLRDQLAISYLGREPSAIPTPATTESPEPNLKISAANTHRHSSITSPPAPAPAPPHLPLLCCCCVRVRGVCVCVCVCVCFFFFSCFVCIAPRARGVCAFFSSFLSYRPRRPKGPTSLCRKCPGIAVSAPGAYVYTCKIIAPRGAFYSHIITVVVHH